MFVRKSHFLHGTYAAVEHYYLRITRRNKLILNRLELGVTR